MDDLITRQALGRVATIGDLYDARRDQLCRYNIFKDKNIPANLLVTKKNKDKQSTIMYGDALEEKFEKLQIEDELKV